MNVWLNFLVDSLAFGATFIYGSTGKLLRKRADTNLGIPGIMCIGGASGCYMLNDRAIEHTSCSNCAFGICIHLL